MSENRRYKPTDRELRSAAEVGEAPYRWWTCSVCNGLVTTGKQDCYCGAVYEWGQEIESRETDGRIEIVLPDETLVLALFESGRIQIVVPGQIPLDGFAWGIVLNDIARNVATEAGEGLADQVEFLTELKRGFEAEWRTPTAWPKKVGDGA